MRIDTIVSASHDQTLKVWDARTGARLSTLSVSGPLKACAFHPDGEHIVAVGGGRRVFFAMGEVVTEPGTHKGQYISNRGMGVDWTPGGRPQGPIPVPPTIRRSGEVSPVYRRGRGGWDMGMGPLRLPIRGHSTTTSLLLILLELRHEFHRSWCSYEAWGI